MNRLRDLVGIVAICATATFFTGCGGDDDDNGAPAQIAPETLNGKTYNLTDAGAGGSIAFAADGSGYTLTQGAGAAETGTFVADRQGDVWNVTTTDTAGTTTSALSMTFTGNETGTYAYTRPGQDPVNGSFALAGGGNPDPDPDPDPDPNPDPGTVTAPATLSQATFTTGPGGGIGEGTIYTVTFTGGTSGTFSAVNPQGDPMGSGNFTYTPSGNTAHLVMNYDQNNDSDDITLSFNSAPGGTGNTYTGTQVVSGTTYPATGTFTY